MSLSGKIAETNEGISDEYRWKLNQPGFLRVEPDCAGNLGQFLKKKKDIEWDGTFSQPVLPLADKEHRDASGYWWL